MDDAPQLSGEGSLALVSYIPGPLGSFLNELRRSLTGEDSPYAHITILPPRPLTVSVNLASQKVLKLLAGFTPFAVEFSSIRRFCQTNVLYVSISEGSDSLHAVHAALNEGDLVHDEEFEFLPHLTLAHREPVSHLDELRHFAAIRSWDAACLSRGFLLHEIVCLWLPPDGLQCEWGRLWSYSLKTRKTVFQQPPTRAATNQTC